MMKKYLLFPLIFIAVCANAQTSDSKIYSLFLQKQYEKVITVVLGSDKVLESFENFPKLTQEDYYYAGLSAEAIEDNQLAAVFFKKSVDFDSTFIPSQISLAQAFFQNEEFAAAIEIFAKLLETDTLNAFLWSNLGDCYSKMGLHPLAYECYQNAFYINPKNSSNTLKLIVSLGALRNTENVEEALFYCDSTLAYHENHKPLLRRKASILFTNQIFLKAVPVLEKLLSLRDSSATVLKQAGICQSVFRNYDEAIFLLRKANKLLKSDTEVMLHLASSLVQKPEYFDEAVELIAEIRKKAEPDSSVIYKTHTLLAQCFLGVKDTVNAILQYYYSMNDENRADRMLQMTHLANYVTPETPHTLLWYVHYYFVQHYKREFERRKYALQQKAFSQMLLTDYYKYMHSTAKKKVNWQTFDGKLKTITMDELRKMF